MDLFPNFDDEKILGLFSLQNKIGENQIRGFLVSVSLDLNFHPPRLISYLIRKAAINFVLLFRVVAIFHPTKLTKVFS